ncbi:MAG: hypothetical protein K2W97_03740 [Chthoniobacterales bacterium]|nr:hypothetical protein [Chthoniobacterales bacterium]
MTAHSHESRLGIWSLSIASSIWIINSIGLFIRPFLSPALTQSIGSIMGLFFVLSYWILFPICIVMSLVALIKRSGSSINCIGTLILAAPPVLYIIYSAIQLHLQQSNG